MENHLSCDAPVPHVIPNADRVWLHPRAWRLAWTVDATLVPSPRQRRTGYRCWHVRRLSRRSRYRFPLISGSTNYRQADGSPCGGTFYQSNDDYFGYWCCFFSINLRPDIFFWGFTGLVAGSLPFLPHVSCQHRVNRKTGLARQPYKQIRTLLILSLQVLQVPQVAHLPPTMLQQTTQYMV